MEPSNCHREWDDSSDYDSTFGRADAQAFNTSGTSGIPMFPLVWFNSVVFNTEVYDFASSGINRAPAGLGSTGDPWALEVTYINMYLWEQAL